MISINFVQGLHAQNRQKLYYKYVSHFHSSASHIFLYVLISYVSLSLLPRYHHGLIKTDSIEIYLIKKSLCEGNTSMVSINKDDDQTKSDSTIFYGGKLHEDLQIIYPNMSRIVNMILD